MKILIDGRPIRSPMSGSAAFVINLTQELNDKGIDVTLYLQNDKGRNAELRVTNGLNSITTNTSKILENLLAEISIPPKELIKYNESIIHETYFAQIPIVGARKIATIHDVIPLDFPSWFTWRNSFFAKRNFFRQIKECKHIVFSSNYTYQRAMNYYDRPVSTSVIHLAVSEKIRSAFGSYYGLLNNSLKIKEGEGYVLMVGNIEPRKNIPLVAEGVGILNKRLGLDLDLVIAGKANYRDEDILIQASKALGKNPVCLGFVDESRKIELYQQCACHVYASKYEGFGLPPIESLIIGSPTVIAQNSSLTEITPDPSFGFRADEVEDLVDSMEHNLYRSSHLNDKINMILLKNYFSWSRVAEDYYSIYKRIS